MRLYGMYWVCKKYLPIVEKMSLEARTVNGNTVKTITNWKQRSAIINELANVAPIREAARKFYNTVPVIYRDQDKFDITVGNGNDYITARTQLIVAMKTVVAMYETINNNITTNEDVIGFDIKLPQFSDVGEFSKCLADLDFIIKQCPYLKQDNASIKYGSVDVGSTWLAFLVIGVTATTILTNLGKFVDAAIKVKSHIVTVKMQEEALRSIAIKNDIAAEVLDAFKQTNNVLTQNCVKELENILGELKDGEERDKVGRSLEKLGFWMDKGLQIYSAIDAPAEIKDVFPAQEDISFLSDDIQKLIEMKKDQ